MKCSTQWIEVRISLILCSRSTPPKSVSNERGIWRTNHVTIEIVIAIESYRCGRTVFKINGSSLTYFLGSITNTVMTQGKPKIWMEIEILASLLEVSGVSVSKIRREG